jgi:hypothetical protein
LLARRVEFITFELIMSGRKSGKETDSSRVLLTLEAEGKGNVKFHVKRADLVLEMS